MRNCAFVNVDSFFHRISAFFSPAGPGGGAQETVSTDAVGTDAVGTDAGLIGPRRQQHHSCASHRCFRPLRKVKGGFLLRCFSFNERGEVLKKQLAPVGVLVYVCVCVCVNVGGGGAHSDRTEVE